MSKRTTPAKSAAAKRAAFANQRQQFAALGSKGAKSYGPTKAQQRDERAFFSSMKGCGFVLHGGWVTIY